MYAIYGNHDIVRRKEPSFYSGIVLRDTEQKKDICLTHGHQSEPVKQHLLAAVALSRALFLEASGRSWHTGSHERGKKQYKKGKIRTPADRMGAGARLACWSQGIRTIP